MDKKDEEELERIEEKLLEEEEKKREETMLVSGKSVFRIKEMKDKRHSDGSSSEWIPNS